MLKPIDSQKWGFTTAAHLLNRAGFGGTPAEIESLAKLTPQEAVLSLVNYEKIPDPSPNPEWAKADPQRAVRRQAIRAETDPEKRQMLQRQEQQGERQNMIELKHWWLQRMAKGPRPLQEKMTLFWHGHFATSQEKVRESYFMWRQNDLFRQQGMGNWLQLLIAVAKDPAMLIWLDQAQSRAESPNENFAREVMELFALGEGHYTEKDITEAARALTGWTVDRPNEVFINRPRLHDTGVKTVLGRTGPLNGEDVLKQIVAQPQAAKFITAKLWNFFAGEYPPVALNTALADYFRLTGSSFKPLLAAMFRSEEFYAESLIRNQVKSPVQWLVGAVRTLERELPPPQVCLALTRNLGQDLFAPPNVKGWDGGLSWITTNNLLSRYNEAAMLVQGDPSAMRGVDMGMRPLAGPRANRGPVARIQPVQVSKILSEAERSDKTKLLAALERRLLQGKLKDAQQKTLIEYLDSNPAMNDGVILNAIRLMMSTPEYQLT